LISFPSQLCIGSQEGQLETIGYDVSQLQQP